MVAAQSRATYMFDGDHLARGLLNALVHYSKAATCREKNELIGLSIEAEGNSRRTAKLLQDLVMTCDSPVCHVVSVVMDLRYAGLAQQSNNDRAGLSCTMAATGAAEVRARSGQIPLYVWPGENGTGRSGKNGDRQQQQGGLHVGRVRYSKVNVVVVRVVMVVLVVRTVYGRAWRRDSPSSGFQLGRSWAGLVAGGARAGRRESLGQLGHPGPLNQQIAKQGSSST